MPTEQHAEPIEACLQCATACDVCAAACLLEDDVKAMARCIALDIDCAATCRLAAAFMARDSEFSMPVCTLCAEICEACAEECAQHDSMAHCAACAAACQRCATACRSVSEFQ